MSERKEHIEALIFCEFCKQTKVNPQKIDLVFVKTGLNEVSRRLHIVDKTDLYFKYGCLVGFYGDFARLPIKYAIEIVYDEFKFCKTLKGSKQTTQELIEKLVKMRLYSTGRYKAALKSKRYRERKQAIVSQ